MPSVGSFIKTSLSDTVIHILLMCLHICEKCLLALSCMSVCLPARIGLAHTGWIFMTCDIGELLKSIEKIQIWYINRVDHFT